MSIDGEVVESYQPKETNKPLVLYRGYIPTENRAVQTSSSKEALSKLRQERLDPHDRQFADQLIWATPDQDYAKKVTAMRFIVRMATDANYQRLARGGKASLPTLATYNIRPETRIFNAEGNTLEETNFGTSNQFVIESVSPNDVKNRVLSRDSASQLLDIFDRQVGSRLDDTVARATFFLDQQTGSNFTQTNTDFRNQTLGEALGEASRYYEDKGVDKMEVEESLAKGLFSASFYMSTVASSMQFVE